MSALRFSDEEAPTVLQMDEAVERTLAALHLESYSMGPHPTDFLPLIIERDKARAALRASQDGSLLARYEALLRRLESVPFVTAEEMARQIESLRTTNAALMTQATHWEKKAAEARESENALRDLCGKVLRLLEDRIDEWQERGKRRSAIVEQLRTALAAPAVTT